MRSKNLAYTVGLVLAIVAPFVFNNPYIRHILVICLIWAILSISFNLIAGYANLFTFGHAGFLAVGAYTSGLLALKGVPVWLSMSTGVIAAGVFGFLVGFICLRRGLKGMNFWVFTFGFGMVMWIIIRGWIEVTHGSLGLRGIPPLTIGIPNLFEIAFVSEISFYYLALVLLIGTLFFVNRLLRSRFGNAVVALGKNEQLASSVGVDVFRHVLFIFVISSMMAGLAGALYSEYMRMVFPTIASMYYMFMIVGMVIVGGVNTLWGPVLGAFIFVGADEILRFTGEFRIIAWGVVLLLFILFMPRGTYYGLLSLWSSFIVKIARLRRVQASGTNEGDSGGIE